MRNTMNSGLFIVSGGQTGADRAALDVAVELGIPCGGWCPAGRWAEDGPIDSKYPLQETVSADVNQRTQKNVEDSDATLVFYWHQPTGGTAFTLSYAMETKKPLLAIDAKQFDHQAAVIAMKEFITQHPIKKLNIAGPRASEAPEAYGYTRNLLLEFFKS